MSMGRDELSTAEAAVRAGEVFDNMGIDTAECLENPVLAAFFARIVDIEQAKIDRGE